MNKSVLMTIIVLLIIFAVITIAAEVILFLTSNGHANLDFAIKNSKKSEHEKLRDELRRRDWEWLQKQKTEEYFINSNDGLRLRALYLPAPEGEGSNRLAFCIHGIQSNGTREFVTAARYFYEHGIGSFIIDQRACGKSEGRYVTYGCREAGDCLLWLDFIKAEFGADMRVFVYGMSMGGTITVAFRPNYYKEHGYFFAPYSYQNERGEMCKRQLGTAENDYFTQEWYSEPMKSGVASWCEPYFDEGGGKILMSTYSVPVKDAKGETYAILTADLSLEQLRGYVAAIRPYPQSYAILKSAKGEYLVGPPKGVKIANDKTIMIKDKAENGWSVEIVCPMAEILKSAQRLVIKIIIFSASGLALIFLLSWFYSSRLQRATAERERIASELTIASKIQVGILRRILSPSCNLALSRGYPK